MKEKYKWYLPLTENEEKYLWEKAVLTVDTNVLLDLYRYNEDVRNEILANLEKFSHRVWLSHQASEEFIRNRNNTIVNVDASFERAKNEIKNLVKELNKVVENLKNTRIVSNQTIESLEFSVKKSIDEASKSIELSHENHPNYLQNDPILLRVIELFDNSVGDDFSDEILEDVKQEAQRRIENKIPPGYEDAKNKEGDRKYGDYYLWYQVLDYMKNKQIPMILVTSEKKGDWWEKYRGKKVGPRPEMLEESMKETGQRLLIYSTTGFIKFAAELSGSQVQEEVLEEIKAVNKSKSSSSNKVELLEHSVGTSSEHENTGQLIVSLSQPVYNLTCSGRLEPSMYSSPDIRVTLTKHPDNMPEFKVGAGTGTVFDFNVHVRSIDYSEFLPVGIYVFDYSAVCHDT